MKNPECEYYNKCNMRIFGRINCINEHTIKQCSNYKMYKKEDEENYIGAICLGDKCLEGNLK